MKKDTRLFFKEPKQVKLWETNMDNIVKNSDTTEIGNINFENTGTIIDFGSSLLSAVSNHLSSIKSKKIIKIDLQTEHY